jgi:hypothetical protein
MALALLMMAVLVAMLLSAVANYQPRHYSLTSQDEQLVNALRQESHTRAALVVNEPHFLELNNGLSQPRWVGQLEAKR